MTTVNLKPFPFSVLMSFPNMMPYMLPHILLLYYPNYARIYGEYEIER